MPNLILDLEVTRVDLVDEGANSAAFIKLYKRKESNSIMNLDEILSKMKPEHAEIIRAEIAKAKGEVPETTATELAKARTEANEAIEKSKVAEKTAQDACAKAKEMETKMDQMKQTDPNGNKPTDEEVMKSLDPAVQEIFKSLKAKKDAAEATLKQVHEAQLQEDAVAKAKELKALPVEEAKLVEIMKGIKPELFEILKAASTAIETGVLTEVGKGKGAETGTGSDAWALIEKKAGEIETRDKVSKQKAIAVAIKENPDLYRKYLDGGAN